MSNDILARTDAGAAERQAIDQVIQALTTRFPEVPARSITERVRRAHDRFAGAPIRDFVPVLIEREVRVDLVTGVRGPLADNLLD